MYALLRGRHGTHDAGDAMTLDDIQALADCAQLASSNAWAFRRVATWQQLGHIREQLHERVTMGWTPLGPVEMLILRDVIAILAQAPTLSGSWRTVTAAIAIKEVYHCLTQSQALYHTCPSSCPGSIW